MRPLPGMVPHLPPGCGPRTSLRQAAAARLCERYRAAERGATREPRVLVPMASESGDGTASRVRLDGRGTARGSGVEARVVLRVDREGRVPCREVARPADPGERTPRQVGLEALASDLGHAGGQAVQSGLHVVSLMLRRGRRVQRGTTGGLFQGSL